jgi:hypothetical protein
MKRMEILFNHFIATVLLIFLVFQINSCEKESQVVVEDSEPVSDIDGNVYKAVNIGGEIWMAENLRVSHFRNGDLIP